MLDLLLVTVGERRPRSGPLMAEAERYLKLAGPTLPCSAAHFSSEEALLADAAGNSGRTPRRPVAALWLFDSRGQLPTSEEFAEAVRTLRDSGAPRLLLAVGPPDGWSDAARARAARLLSFGRVTLPHELARLVAAEQIYRASTILSGHPYHLGH